MPTDFIQLHEPIVADAIRTVNFFNGRLLTGSDLGREQQARREALSHIGQALGDGVAAGLEVAYVGNSAPGNGPAVTIQPGLAINREGAALSLAAVATIALNRTSAANESTVACLFDDCASATPGAAVADKGLYLLVISRAFVSEGRAQVSGMGDAGQRCAFDATVEAVQFRLIPVPATATQIADPAVADYRNRIAYRCFGEGVLRAWPANLAAATPRRDDLIETMRGYGLGDGDVPLALIHFASATTEIFVDLWSGRRPLCRRDRGDALALIADPRRLEVGRAMYRQFQDEIHDLQGANALAQTRASDRFAWLPPAGFLPFLAQSRIDTFFHGLTVRGPQFIDAAAVEPLLKESFACPAIPTKPGTAGANHAIWLYQVAKAPGSTTLIFASGHLPYRGDARFNLNHWNQANYALIP